MLRAARLLPLSAAVRHASSLSAGAGDTIFAVATPPGRAALAIVRVSGSAVPSHLLPHLAPLVKPREASLRTIRHSVTSEPLDRGIVLYFPAPHSATGEHVVELHVHGGRAVVAAVCDSLAAIPGVRPAHAGEFTRRAFLNGRMDLTAVEGLADLLNADTQAQRRQALLQSDGELGALYDSWRARLLRALAHVEANIDFAEDEDDCRDHVYVAAEATVAALAAEMRAHLNDAHRGEIIREGVAVSLLGPPNAGKSSLFNALAKRPAAIVSHIPGTTRDVLELQLDIGGLPITLRDTAGVRTDTADDIERVGVERALASARASPVKLLVVDASAPALPSHLRELADANTIVVLNKVDALPATDASLSDAMTTLRLPSVAAIVRTSAVTRTGVDDLVAALQAAVLGVLDPEPARARDAAHTAVQSSAAPTGVLITRQRHRHHVQECLHALDRFLARPASIDMAAEDLRLGTHELGCLTGRVDVEELLDVIFSDFCIGK